MRIIALTTSINKGDQWVSTAKSLLAQVWDPEPEKGLTENHALEAVTHTMVCDILWPLHQLLDVFWCLKCFESGLPGTGDRGWKNRNQSPGCQRECHSTLAFWVSSCPLCSCSVTFHVLTSKGWLTWPEIYRGHWKVVFYFKFYIKGAFFSTWSKCYFEVLCASSANGTCKYWKKRNVYCVRQDLTWMKSSKLFIQQGITSIGITQLCYPHTLSPPTNRMRSSSRYPP